MSRISLKNKYKSLPVQVKASLWFLICSFLQKGISMITTPIFTRLLNTAEYGQFNVFNSWYGIVAIIVGLSLTSGVHTQGLIKYDEERKIFSSSLLGLTTVLTVLWIAIYLIAKDFWNEVLNLTTIQVLAMLVMVWTTAVFNFWANEQRVTYSYKVLVIVTLFVSFAKPLVGIFLVTHYEDKVTARILGIVFVELVFYSWMYIYQMHKGKKFFSAKFWKYALIFNLPLVPHYLSQTVLISADRIMIQNMVGDSEAGIYSLAYSISLIMTLFNTALGQTLNPWIYQKIKDKKSKDIAPIAYSTLILIAVVNILFIFLAPEVVAIFAPSSYHEAVFAIPPIAMSVYFLYCYDLFAKFAFYYEKTTQIMIATMAGAILNIGLNYIGIKLYGYIAAAYTTLICYMAYSFFHYFLMIRVCKKYNDNYVPYSTKHIVLISMVFIVMGFIGLATYHSDIFRYIIIAVMVAAMIVFRKRIRKLADMIFAIKKA